MRCFGASSTNSRRRCRSPRRSPQGGPLTLQFLPLAEAPATRKKCRDWRREQRALGCRLPIRHVATRRLCRLFYFSYHLISAKELYEGASSLKLLFCKVYLFNKLQEIFLRNARIAVVLFYSSSPLFNWVLCEDVHDTLIPQNDV